ncbi:MAG: MBL fold metallo-hydrolase [Patescibacteria group bacterium]
MARMMIWKTFGVWIAVIILLSVFCWKIFSAFPDGRFHISFLDVGQGDSMLLKTARGQMILVDSGPGSRVMEALSKNPLVGPFDRYFDAIIVTHFETDHGEGFLSVLDSYDVGRIFINGELRGSELESGFFRRAKEKDIPVFVVRSDLDLQIDDETFVDFVYPFFGRVEHYNGKSLNNTSVSLRVIHGGKPILFSGGDMEFPLEEKLLTRKSLNLSAEVFKVSHHGSKGTNSDTFLRAVHPKIAVISCGFHNRYGHPHAEALSRLSAVGASIRRTDLEGTVDITF